MVLDEITRTDKLFPLGEGRTDAVIGVGDLAGRFYAMPYILGYDVWGMLAFPLESDFSRQLYQLFN